jgi:hypothetical protein
VFLDFWGFRPLGRGRVGSVTLVVTQETTTYVSLGCSGILLGMYRFEGKYWAKHSSAGELGYIDHFVAHLLRKIYAVSRSTLWDDV